MSDNITLERLSSRDRRALPERVHEAVLDVISNRGLKPGDRLPPEPALASMLAVSRATLREAIRVLEAEGVLARTRGVGTFVAGTPFLQNNLNANFGVTDLIRSTGHVAGTMQRTVRVDVPTAPMRTALAIAEDARVVIIERARTAGGRPVVLSTDVLPVALLPPGERLSDTFGESLYEWVQARCGITIHHGVARIRPVVAPGSVARRLRVRPGSPLLALEQTDFTVENRPILYSLEYHVPDVFEITVYRTGPRGTR